MQVSHTRIRGVKKKANTSQISKMGGSLKESGYSPNTSGEQGDLHGRGVNSNRRCKYL